MKAFLLAAGKGTRLKPLTDKIPKVMIQIKGKPILEYHIEQLAEAGIKDIFINLHYLPEKIKNYFKDGEKWDVNIKYSYEPKILGTAGAVKKIAKELRSDPFLVVYGDNFLEINYKNFIEFAETKDGIGTVTVFEKEDVKGSGILYFDDNCEVTRFKEKPRKHEIFSHWISAGVFYFKNEIIKYIETGFSDFGFDVVPKILKNKEKLYAYKLKGKVWGIDNLELLKVLTKRKTRVNNFKEDRFRELHK